VILFKKKKQERVKMKKKKIIFLFVLTIFSILALTTKVHAAGLNGTTIVINPRSWWN